MGPTCTIRNLEVPNSVRVHCSPTFCSLTKSTVHRQRTPLRNGRKSKLPSKVLPTNLLIVVLATQNPIEQEGTYPLPEAQMDRFLMKMSMGYPDRAEEKAFSLVENSVERINTMLSKSHRQRRSLLCKRHSKPFTLTLQSLPTSLKSFSEHVKTTVLSTGHLLVHRNHCSRQGRRLLLQSLDATMSFLMTSRYCIANHQPPYRHEAKQDSRNHWNAHRSKDSLGSSSPCHFLRFNIKLMPKFKTCDTCGCIRGGLR